MNTTPEAQQPTPRELGAFAALCIAASFVVGWLIADLVFAAAAAAVGSVICLAIVILVRGGVGVEPRLLRWLFAGGAIACIAGAVILGASGAEEQAIVLLSASLVMALAGFVVSRRRA